MANLVKTTTDERNANFWSTTWAAFADAETLYGREFAVDVCAEPATTKCRSFIGHPMLYDLLLDCRTGPAIKTKLRNLNCLALDTLMDSVQWPADWWCNPPFDQKEEFIQKARHQQHCGRPGMMLLPYEPLTQWWRRNLKSDCIIYEPDGRYNFMERDGETIKTGVNFGSVLVAFPTMQLGDSIRIPYTRGLTNPRIKS